MAAKKKPTPKKKLSRPTAAAKAKKPAHKAGKQPAKPAAKAKRPAPRPSGKRPAAKRPVRQSKRPALRAKKPAAPRRKVAPKLVDNPRALALAKDIAHVALDKKASDVLIIDTRARASAVGYDYVVLATGESDRQLGAIADALNETLKPKGHRATSVEASPDWVLVNYDDVVTHLFTPDKRDVYDLEGLWSDAPRVAVTH